MALSGLEIYKLLPGSSKDPAEKAHGNCKECGFPTCLAFAMKLAAKQADLSSCKYVSEDAKAKLSAAAAPPIRLITLAADGREVKVGNETVLFRHEKTFYNPAGVFVRVLDTMPAAEITALAKAVADYKVDYVGMSLRVDGLAVECASGDPTAFALAVATVNAAAALPLILVSEDPKVLEAGAAKSSGSKPLLCAATAANWEAMAPVAKAAGAPLVVRAETLQGLAELTEKLVAAGVEDLVLDPAVRPFGASLAALTQLRRLALKKNFRPLGYPVIAFPYLGTAEPGMEMLLAGQQVAKYAGFVVLSKFEPAEVYPLLVLRANLFTDPQKPIQVEPGIYEINKPTAESPVLVTTNFSITYFAVANEMESSGQPAWLLVADAEGMSVLTAWAAGKFDAEKIAKAVKGTGVAEKINHRKVVIPGHVAVLMGELEEELAGWQIKVGPREAVDLPRFLKTAW
ncbi:MAG: acetyl-CoA decarbonylase/synthase complex subunit gamma [Anaerolineae bacterium]|jgi:acetyl-CoA decarbonylase/synthase complex subunit gamma|nr:acetyl-CoA decarbonylase/synthase complex subunit gamma [Anaerolineae bacterium]